MSVYRYVAMPDPERIIGEAKPLGDTYPGIYYLVAAGSIVYIGQSTNVLARIATHISEKKRNLTVIFRFLFR